MSNENKLFIQIPNLEQGSAEWHEWRSEVIGASDAPAIMGENPWKSKKALIEEKLGIRKQFSGNAATRRGSQLEPEARRIYTSLTNTDIDPSVLQSKTYLWQAASVDGINATKGILVEIKCGVKSYEYTERTNKVPLYYKAQLQHILCVTGFESINYFSYLPGKIPLSIKVFRDEEYIQELISAELEFIDELKLRGFTPRNTLYGETKPNSNASSHAKQTLQNGDTFEGNFVNGKRNGHGVYTWANGVRYEGNWIDGNRTGKGIYTWANGERYEGDFIEGIRTGKGIHTWSNGDRYEGDYADGKITGKGIYTWADGTRYEGDFIEGVRTGRGIYTWPNGNTYEGDFVDQKENGIGTYTWINGDKYIREFENGYRTGNAIKYLSNGDRYEGEFWEDWLISGIKIYANGNRYEGELVGDEFDGKGIYKWANGDRYEGDWVNGKQTGKGIFTSADGQRYEGDFLNNLFHGKGIFSYTYRTKYEGNFLEGKFDGYGILIWYCGDTLIIKIYQTVFIPFIKHRIAKMLNSIKDNTEICQDVIDYVIAEYI